MAKLRNNKDICLFCFGDLDENRICKACGKRADDKPNLPHQIPKRSMLNKRYLMGKVIGEGGFGITYFAWDTQKCVKVAIKEYYPSGYVSRDPRSNKVIINSKLNHAASNRGLKRFIEEAQNLSKIRNLSGIVSVLDFFALNDTAYIVMEYLDGISLKKYIHRKGKLTATNALTILKPVIYSLEAVHDQGLIHRDISPDNILLTRDGEVKLIDFGASKHANPDGQSVSIVLKQGFAPEEQYRLHGEQGPWTDIYAMAVTIYFCITGQLPPESIQRMYEDTMLPPSALGAKIGPETEKALLKALAVFGKDRYRDIPSFAHALYSSLSFETEEEPQAKRETETAYAHEESVPETPKQTEVEREEVKPDNLYEDEKIDELTAKNEDDERYFPQEETTILSPIVDEEVTEHSVFDEKTETPLSSSPKETESDEKLLLGITKAEEQLLAHTDEDDEDEDFDIPEPFARLGKTEELFFEEVEKAVPTNIGTLKKEVPSEFPRRKTVINRKFTAEALRIKLLGNGKAKEQKIVFDDGENKNERTVKSYRKFNDFASSLHSKLL